MTDHVSVRYEWHPKHHYWRFDFRHSYHDYPNVDADLVRNKADYVLREYLRNNPQRSGTITLDVPL